LLTIREPIPSGAALAGLLNQGIETLNLAVAEGYDLFADVEDQSIQGGRLP
jgi:hypothetical protein